MRAVVVMGGSAGALGVLRSVIAALPADFPLPVCVVLHIGRHPTRQADLLDRVAALRVVDAVDGTLPQAGTVYLAPPDRHLQLRGGRLHLSQGPRENFARPAIDPLFRSAAQGFGPGAVGVLLSGRLNDGSAGLYEIRQLGGVAVVQDPATAGFPAMPSNAVAQVGYDHCVAPEEMAPLLASLASRLAAAPGPSRHAGPDAPSTQAWQPERPVTLTCPDCGGAMRREDSGNLVGYACHIGHRLSGEAMADGQAMLMEKHLEQVMRLANERAELCRILATQASGREDDASPDWARMASEAAAWRTVLEGLLGRHGGDSIGGARGTAPDTGDQSG